MSTINIILLILTGGVGASLIFMAGIYGWNKGTAFVYKQFEPPEMMPPPPTAEQLRESISKITCPYDIVFDSLVTTQFATGVYSRGWDRIYGDIVNSVTSFAKDLDPSIKTIVLRSIKINKAGRPEFAFEPIITLPKQ